MHHTIAGIDLAKKEIQICLSKYNKVQSNQANSLAQFALAYRNGILIEPKVILLSKKMPR